MIPYRVRLPAMFVIAGTFAFAQPVLSSGSPAVNSASYRIAGSSGSGVAQGSIFTVFGTGLGPSPAVGVSAFPLKPELGGTSITVTVDGVPTSALIIYTSNTQVNAVLPSSTPTGAGTIALTYGGQTSVAVPITVVARSFGIYTFDSSGWGQAIVTVPRDPERPLLNTIIQTLHPGEIGILWGTGLGAITASDAEPPPTGNLAGDIELFVGNARATVTYQGRSGCCSGLDQINFQVPSDVEGCYVPVAVRNGSTVSNIATISVSRSGQTCSDSVMGQELVDRLASGQTATFGYIRLESISAPFQGGSATRANSDYAVATFSRYTPQSAGLAQYGVSSGYCIAIDCSNGCGLKSFSGTAADSSPAQLDAGAVIVVDGQGSRSVPRVFAGYYGSVLNSNTARFLWSGLQYIASGVSGEDVGQFSIARTSGLPRVNITNLSRGQAVPLAGDLTVEWTGGNPEIQDGQVTIGGFSIRDLAFSNASAFQCTAPASAKRFTIPDWIISTLPPSGTEQIGTSRVPLGWIWIGQYGNPVTFTAEGLDRGVLTDAFFNGIGIFYE